MRLYPDQKETPNRTSPAGVDVCLAAAARPPHEFHTLSMCCCSAVTAVGSCTKDTILDCKQFAGALFSVAPIATAWESVLIPELSTTGPRSTFPSFSVVNGMFWLLNPFACALCRAAPAGDLAKQGQKAQPTGAKASSDKGQPAGPKRGSQASTAPCCT